VGALANETDINIYGKPQLKNKVFAEKMGTPSYLPFIFHYVLKEFLAG